MTCLNDMSVEPWWTRRGPLWHCWNLYGWQTLLQPYGTLLLFQTSNYEKPLRRSGTNVSGRTPDWGPYSGDFSILVSSGDKSARFRHQPLSVTACFLPRSIRVLHSTYPMDKIATVIGIAMNVPINGYAARHSPQATPAHTLPIMGRINRTPAAVPRMYVAIPSEFGIYTNWLMLRLNAYVSSSPLAASAPTRSTARPGVDLCSLMWSNHAGASFSCANEYANRLILATNAFVVPKQMTNAVTAVTTAPLLPMASDITCASEALFIA
jgi:hypothetical protein